MQRTVKFVAVEKLNMRAVFAVSVGDEKKLARVFGAANERRWTRSDYPVVCVSPVPGWFFVLFSRQSYPARLL